MNKTAAAEMHRTDRAVVEGHKMVVRLDRLELLQAQGWGMGRGVGPSRRGLGRTKSGTGSTGFSGRG